jgi:hypothetical protein
MDYVRSLPCSQKPVTGPILGQMNPVFTLQSYFCKIHFKDFACQVLRVLTMKNTVFWAVLASSSIEIHLQPGNNLY